MSVCRLANVAARYWPPIGSHMLWPLNARALLLNIYCCSPFVGLLLLPCLLGHLVVDHLLLTNIAGEHVLTTAC